jgi:UPF0271 protein
MVLDINMDVGEGLDNEGRLFNYLSSCNIACGGHAGDAKSIARIVQLAKKQQVKVGAHPSFPDKENFGRVVMDLSNEGLKASIASQLLLFKEVAINLQADIHHVKAHGALYNLAASNNTIADLFLEVTKDCLDVPVYAPFNSVIAKRAKRYNTTILFEAFADRNYNDDYSLVSRTDPQALILESNNMFAHVLEMIDHQRVKTLSGKYLPMRLDTLCLHSDSKDAEILVKTLHKNLLEYGLKIA